MADFQQWVHPKELLASGGNNRLNIRLYRLNGLVKPLRNIVCFGKKMPELPIWLACLPQTEKPTKIPL